MHIKLHALKQTGKCTLQSYGHPHAIWSTSTVHKNYCCQNCWYSAKTRSNRTLARSVGPSSLKICGYRRYRLQLYLLASHGKETEPHRQSSGKHYTCADQNPPFPMEYESMHPTINASYSCLLVWLFVASLVREANDEHLLNEKMPEDAKKTQSQSSW